MKGSKKRLIPFNYFGGKFTHTDWIIKKLPVTKIYVEVFGGSGVILFNREPSKIETYNDINSTVVNFFKVLRDNPDELIRKIYLTPYSREEYFECYKNMYFGDEVERARRFYVIVNQSFNGSYNRQTGWKMSTKVSRAIITEAVNRWLTKVPNLIDIIERLRMTQILNLDFRKIFEKFDSTNTLFYCDPPYVLSTRGGRKEFEHEMSDSDHEEFLNRALKLDGKVAISGYDSDMYNDILKDFWKSEAKAKRSTLFHSSRKEVLWTNYNAEDVNINLFSEKTRGKNEIA